MPWQRLLANLMGWTVAAAGVAAVTFCRRYSAAHGHLVAALLCGMPAFLLLTREGMWMSASPFSFLVFFALSLWLEMPPGGSSDAGA